MEKRKQLSGTEIVEKLQRTIQLHKDGMVNEAITGYEEVIPFITAIPNLLQLHGNVGALYLSTGDYEHARSHFEESIKIDKNNALAHFNLAVLLTSKMDQHASALKHCAIAIKLDKGNFKFYHLMGNILQSLGKEADSEKYFQMAEELAAAQSLGTENSGSRDTKRSKLQTLMTKLPFSLENFSSQSISISGTDYDVTVISNSPLIFTIENFLTAEECKSIQDRSISKLERSYIMGNAVNTIEESYDAAAFPSSEKTDNVYRSSYNAWLPLDQELSSIQGRVSSLLNLPLGYVTRNSEDLQVVRYDVDGEFKLHQDSSTFHSRLFTVLFYLNDIADEGGDGSKITGGETWFPFANIEKDPERTVERAILEGLNMYEEYTISNSNLPLTDFNHEGLPGVTVKPSKGKVVVFCNYDIETEAINPHSIHAGLPIRHLKTTTEATIDGKVISERGEAVEKWVANYWIKFNKDEL